MIHAFRFWSQLEGLNPLNQTAPVTKGAGLVFKDLLVIVATGLALGLILLLSARYYVRKMKRRHRRHPGTGLSSSPVAALNQPTGEAESPHDQRRHRKRRRRRDHRLRNPTLADTGGLPPPKTEGPSHPPL